VCGRVPRRASRAVSVIHNAKATAPSPVFRFPNSFLSGNLLICSDGCRRGKISKPMSLAPNQSAKSIRTAAPVVPDDEDVPDALVRRIEALSMDPRYEHMLSEVLTLAKYNRDYHSRIEDARRTRQSLAVPTLPGVPGIGVPFITLNQRSFMAGLFRSDWLKKRANAHVIVHTEYCSGQDRRTAKYDTKKDHFHPLTALCRVVGCDFAFSTSSTFRVCKKCKDKNAKKDKWLPKYIPGNAVEEGRRCCETRWCSLREGLGTACNV
jgi:hypothetical protein